MHILFIPSWYSTPDQPIRGSFFREQALALVKAGHKVGILAPPTRLRTRHGLRQMRHNWRQSCHALSFEQDAALATYRIPWWGWQGSVLRAKRAALGLEAFDRYCREQGTPGVIHGHSLLYGGYLAAVIKAQHGIPAVVTEHSSVYIRGPVWPDQRPTLRFIAQTLDRLLVASPQLGAALERYTSPKATSVLPEIVDTAFFTPGAEPDSPFTLTIIARLDSNKAIDLSIRAFAEAFRQDETYLRIRGNGPELPRLKELVGQLGVQRHVEFIEPLPREDIRDLIRSSHAIVSSSYVETFGITLIEAMACGKPVIATRSGGPDSFVTEITGLLVPTGDVAALAGAMRQMAATHTNYDPAAIRAYCVANFSEAAFIQRLEAIYAEVIARSAPHHSAEDTPG